MAEQNSSPDWLPSGWTVEVRVRNNGKKYKCYKDSSNGLKFFSKPEVFRYLNNIEINSHKSMVKREGSHKCSAINSPAMVGEQQLVDSGTGGQIIKSQSLELVGAVKDENIVESSTGDCIPLSEDTSDQRRERTSASSFNLPGAMVVKQRAEKSDPATTVLVSAPVVGAFPEKLPEKGVESFGNKNMQLGLKALNGKKKSDLPRRASKRLAGIDVGPTPELKTNNRSRRVSARWLDAAEASRAGNNADGKPEEHAGEEPRSALNLSSKDLWTDPCIDFAIKTLTGAIPIGDEKNTDVKSSLELPSGDSWGDPCIEFAVKTLTGTNPVSGDLGIQDCFLQQLTSSETKGDKGKDRPRQTIRQ